LRDKLKSSVPMPFKIAPFYIIIFLFIGLSSYGQKSDNLNIKKDAAIDSILIKKIAYNATHPSMGYSVQIYYGSEDLAYKFKADFEMAFPEQTADISFNSPDWKVMIGKFRTHIDADRVLLPIKQTFQSAIVVLTPYSFE